MPDPIPTWGSPEHLDNILKQSGDEAHHELEGVVMPSPQAQEADQSEDDKGSEKGKGNK